MAAADEESLLVTDEQIFRATRTGESLLKVLEGGFKIPRKAPSAFTLGLLGGTGGGDAAEGTTTTTTNNEDTTTTTDNDDYDQNDDFVEYPKEFRAEINLFLSSILSSTTSYTSTAAVLKSLASDAEQSSRALTDLKIEEDELQSGIKSSRDDAQKLLTEATRVRTSLATAQKQLAEKKAKVAGLEFTKSLGSSWTKEQSVQKEELDAQYAGALAALNAKRSTLNSVRQEVALLSEITSRTGAEKAEADKKVSAIRESIAGYRTTSASLQHMKDMKDKALIHSQQEVARLGTEAKERTAAVEEGAKTVVHAQEALKTDRQTLDRYVKEYERLQTKAMHLTEDIDISMKQNEAVAAEIAELEENTEMLRKDEARLRKEKARVEKLHTLTLEKIKETEGKITETEAKVSSLRSQAQELDQEMIAESKKLESKQGNFTDMTREKEVIAKGLTKQGDKTKGALAATSMQHSMKKQLESEVNAYITTMRRLRATIDDCQLARERLVGELEVAAQSYFTAAEGVKLQELQIAALKKKIDEGEVKVKQQHSLYDAVKLERNLFSKQLVQAHEELTTMKHEFKTLSRRIEGLKDSIMSKDTALVKYHFEHHRVDKEKESLRGEAQRVTKQVQACEHLSANQESEIKKLTNIVTDAEAEYTRQKKELEAVQAERMLLLQQLHKRDAELSEVYGKLQVQKSMLANGAAAFAKKVAERDEIAAKIAAKKGELLLAKTQLADTSALEAECHKLDDDLNAEKAKIRALTEELERPINVHRWRGLQDREPLKWALIQRLHELQRRLLEMRDVVKEKEELIKVTEAEYTRLKNHLAKAPTGDMGAEAIAMYQSNLKEKAKQIKMLEADLETARATVDENKREVMRLEENMNRMNDEYIRRRKTAAVKQRRHTALGSMGLASAASTAASFASSFMMATNSGNNNNSNGNGNGGVMGAGAGGGAGGMLLNASTVNAEADRLLAQYENVTSQQEEKKAADSDGEGKDGGR